MGLWTDFSKNIGDVIYSHRTSNPSPEPSVFDYAALKEKYEELCAHHAETAERILILEARVIRLNDSDSYKADRINDLQDTVDLYKKKLKKKNKLMANKNQKRVRKEHKKDQKIANGKKFPRH